VRGSSNKARIATAILALIALGAATLASAAVVQDHGLRLSVLGQVKPYKLPRVEKAPIAVFISGHIGTTDRSLPPQLQRMRIRINQHGLLQDEGLPKCQIDEIQPGSTQRALSNCADALVGSGRFWAKIILPDQRPYPTRGRLLVFNGRKNGRRVIFAHIFTRIPFASSFVITFDIGATRKGPYGTELTASLPESLGSWGFVDRIKLTLRRKYTWHGKQHSYFNASCPALEGANVAAYPLAEAAFFFADRKPISLTLTKSCGVRAS
jgi:hypothetical protein